MQLLAVRIMETATSEDMPLRPTGNMERFNIIRNSLNFYNNIQVSATYTIPHSAITTYSLLPILQSALALALQSQPILGVTIQDEGTREPKWKRLASINLDEIVKIIETDDESHDDWITTGHRTRLDRVDELPVWRIIVAVPSSAKSKSEKQDEFSFTLAFYCHHAIGDGLSAGAFHLTFLSALNTLLSHPTSITPQPTISVPKLPLVDTLEQRCKLPISPWFAIKKIVAAYIYTPPSPLTFTGPPIPSTAPLTPPVSNLLTFSFPNPTVQKLLSKCRDQKTTLTCLITVLVARRLAQVHRSRHKRFMGNIPFSVRKWTKHSALDMGCYTSMVAPPFSCEVEVPAGYISCLTSSAPGKEGEDEKALWTAARQCKAFVEAGTKSERNQAVGLLVFVSDIRGFFLGLLGQKREHTFEVTNIGVLDGGKKEEGKARFESATFSSALCTYADPYCVSVVTVKGREMRVGVNWVRGVTPDGDARGLAGWLEGALRGVAEGYVPGSGVYEEVTVDRKGGVGMGFGIWASVGLIGAAAAAAAWMLLK
ncbi:uncharacterized protein LY89DRAFT_661946 [Mollisia scopiformis]|uniref:Alcohol acetyltransferase n=1 Tax=Mollisia scopiformis TaxID=149040 RepID=A0A132B3U5_MOLSC|nr:uncharacterized protein LY89DRAFT_661946 [Mollisia scopiformis]KUJ06594.1 hypothetical protein LY89DRAFT_661946 [Mollisia scopiformis]